MNGIVVVDASLAFKWLVREENSDRAQAISRSWADDGVSVGSVSLAIIAPGFAVIADSRNQTSSPSSLIFCQYPPQRARSMAPVSSRNE